MRSTCGPPTPSGATAGWPSPARPRARAGTSYRPCGRVIELTTQASLAIPALRQDLRIPPTSGYSDTFVPGVGYSDDGTLWTVFSQSSPSRYVSSWARRQTPDASGAWSAGAALVAAGRGPYGGIAGAGLNQRWGDYVGVARDPSEPGSVWQANQMADTGGGWATRVARLGDDTTPPVVGAPRPFFIGGIQATSTGIPLRIAWSATDGGSGVASVRLERSINGGPFAPMALATLAALDVTTTVTYGVRYQFRVSATDNAGNAVAIPVVGPSFTPTLYSEGSSRVTYAGTWTIARSTSYLGGAARYASVAGRRCDDHPQRPRGGLDLHRRPRRAAARGSSPTAPTRASTPPTGAARCTDG